MLTVDKLKLYERYNWKNQPERLIYIGMCEPRNGRWHQFVKVDKPETVWCEVQDADLHNLEETVSAHAITSMQTEQPVAWVRMRDGNIDWAEDCLFADEHEFDDGDFEDDGLTCVPLYTHPSPVTSMQGDSEPIYQANNRPDKSKIWIDCSKEYYQSQKHEHRRIVYTRNDRVKGVSDERAGFEESYWYRHQTTFISRDDLFRRFTVEHRIGDYINPAVNESWLSWQARSQLSTNTEGWVSVDAQAPEIGEPVLGFNADWIHGDFNPKGTRECHSYGDGSDWLSVVWLDEQDCWVTKAHKPTHWQPLPNPPSINAISQPKGESV